MKPKTTLRLDATDGVYKRIVERTARCRPLVSTPSAAYSIMSSTHSQQKFGAANAPRDPSAISTTEHFLRRFSDKHGPEHETRRDPAITSNVIETCVREGAVRRGRGETVVYEATVDGHEWWLVVGFDGGASALTAYVPGVHGAEKYGGER